MNSLLNHFQNKTPQDFSDYKILSPFNLNKDYEIQDESIDIFRSFFIDNECMLAKNLIYLRL